LLGLHVNSGGVSNTRKLHTYQVLVSTHVSRRVAQHLKSAQKDWNLQTQVRLNAVGSLLASIKTVKSLGISDEMAQHVADQRDKELEAARGVRWRTVAYLMSGG